MIVNEVKIVQKLKYTLDPGIAGISFTIYFQQNIEMLALKDQEVLILYIS